MGRNYKEHAAELGNLIPEKPLIFLKSGSAAVLEEKFKLPSHSSEVNYELEIALRFGEKLEFNGVALALDLTARDLQRELKSLGQPWTIAKSFKQSCPLSAAIDISGQVPHFNFELRINSKLCQHGDTRDMIFSFEYLRTYIVESLPVCPGDYLLTGTPSGVGLIHPGDQFHAIAMSTSGHKIVVNWICEGRQ